MDDNNNNNNPELGSVPEEAGLSENESAAEVSENAKTDDAVRAQLDKTSDFTSEELESELNRLTETFRSELKRTADAEKAEDDAELVQELDDIKEEYEEEAIPEDMLCKCCGERRRDTSFGENYEYCSECREGMKHYPIGIQYLLLAVLVAAFAVFSVYSFGIYYSGFNSQRKAEQYVKENKMTSAQTAFADAGSYFADLDTKLMAKRPYTEAAKYTYNTFTDFSLLKNRVTQLDSVFSETEYKLPWNKKYKELRDTAELQYATASAYYAVFSEYTDATDYSDLPYDEVQGKIEALIGKTASYSDSGTDSSGNTYDNGTVTLSGVNDEVFIRFLQYILAYNCDNDADMDKYIVLAAEGGEDYQWLYGYEYGAYLIREGNAAEAQKIGEALVKRNYEDSNAHALAITSARAQKDLEKADAACTQAEKYCADTAEILRQRAILDMLAGDYASAFENMESAADIGLYYNTVFTYTVAAALAGKTSQKADMESTMQSYSVEYSVRMQQYWNGELTLEQLFTEGSADVM